MLIDKYIENALYLYQCVIVPGFGGFLAAEKSPVTDPVTGKVSPAGRTFTFSSALRVNDGVLASYIANMRDISYSEALVEISRGVDFYLSRLSKGDTVDIAGVGMIKPSEDGELIFTAYGEKSFSREDYGLDSGVVTQEEEIHDESVTHEEETSAVLPVAPEEQEEKTSVEEHEEPKAEDTAENIISAEELTGENTHETQETPSISWEKYNEDKHDESRTGRTGRMMWYILAAVVLLVCLLVYLTRDRIKDYFIVETPATQTEKVIPVTPVAVKDSVEAKDTAATAKPVQTDVKQEKILPDVEDWNAAFVPRNRYYIVSVSLSIEENARKELSRLRAEGYPAVFAGKQGSLYMVAYGAFDSREEMMTMYDSIRMRHNAEVWVKVYNQIPKK